MNDKDNLKRIDISVQRAHGNIGKLTARVKTLEEAVKLILLIAGVEGNGP